MFDKASLKSKMLGLEKEKLDYSRRAYVDYLSGAAQDGSMQSDHDDVSHRVSNGELAEAFECPLHTHAEALEALQRMDFGPKVDVREGALVRFGGQWFVVAIPTYEFTCNSVRYIGISTRAPIFGVMQGKRAGDIFDFRGRCIRIEDVV
jgi:hypothetical protein